MSPRSFRQPGISVENIKHPGSKSSDSIAFILTPTLLKVQKPCLCIISKLVCGVGVDTERVSLDLEKENIKLY